MSTMRQLAEEFLGSRGLADLSLRWPKGKPIPGVDYASGQMLTTLLSLLADFGDQTRLATIAECTSAIHELRRKEGEGNG